MCYVPSYDRMGKQHNKVIKRKKRLSYLKRKKEKLQNLFKISKPKVVSKKSTAKKSSNTAVKKTATKKAASVKKAVTKQPAKKSPAKKAST